MSATNQIAKPSKRVAISEVYLEVLFVDEGQTAKSLPEERMSKLELQWPRGNQSLLERMDYLTSMLPFEMLELHETRPGSALSGLWTVFLKFDGMPKDKRRFEENFMALLNPNRSEFVAREPKT